MAVTVETLEKLERKITLSVPLSTIKTEVDSRLKRLARTVSAAPLPSVPRTQLHRTATA